MGVSGVGSSYTCMYHASTGKISSKDGSDDEFASYYNGELSEESTTLNGYDSKRKHELERLFWLYQEAGGMMGKGNIFDASNECEFEITCTTVNAAKSEYYVNGERVLTCYTGMQYTAEELKQLGLGLGTQPFKTHGHKPYDSLTNSMNIAVGDVFHLGNGYKLTVMDDHVRGEGSDADDERMNQLVRQLTSLIHVADQQLVSSAISAGYGDSSMIIAFLNELGVDTSREFTINGTKLVVKNGRICDAESGDGLPSSIFNKALKRYEEWLYQPLSSRDSWRKPA